MSAKTFFSTNPNKWLGTPKTARNVVPTIPCHLAYGPGQLRLMGGDINLAAAASGTGLAVVLADSEWIAGTWTEATTTYLDKTAEAQAGTADSLVLVDTTINNGFIIGSKQPIQVIGFDVTTASTGGVFDTAYWGFPTSGSQASAAAFQQITQANNFIQPTTPFAATGEQLFVLNHPAAVLVKTVAGDITGFPAGYYAVRVRATTAVTVSASKFARLYVGVELLRQSQLAQHAVRGIGAGVSSRTLTVTNGVAVGAYFGTANIGNNLYLEYE